MSHFDWFGCLKQIQTLKQLDSTKPTHHKFKQSLICTLLTENQPCFRHFPLSEALQSTVNHFPPVQLGLAYTQLIFVIGISAWLTDLRYHLCLLIPFVPLTHWAYTPFQDKRKLYWHSFQFIFLSVTQLFLECFSRKLS